MTTTTPRNERIARLTAANEASFDPLAYEGYGLATRTGGHVSTAAARYACMLPEDSSPAKVATTKPAAKAKASKLKPL